jgi:hypothetical protein
MTSADWLLLSPELTSTSPIQNHAVDLTFRVVTAKDAFTFNTKNWTYYSNQLSQDYQQHVWHKDGVLLYGATYLSANDSVAPFLRPNYVTGDSTPAILDASCLFIAPQVSRLFSGTTVLTAGDNINIAPPVLSDLEKALDDAALQQATDLAGSETHSFVIDDIYTKEVIEEKWLRTINNRPSNSDSRFTLVGDDEIGCYKFTQNYTESDIITGVTRVEPHQLIVYNSCVPCCNCEDFVAQYELLRTLSEKITVLADQYNTAHNLLADEVQPVFSNHAALLVKALRIFKGTQRVVTRSLSEDARDEKDYPFLEIQVLLRIYNGTAQAITLNDLKLTAQPSAETGYLFSAENSGDLKIVYVDTAFVSFSPVTVKIGDTVSDHIRMLFASVNYGEEDDDAAFSIIAEIGSSVSLSISSDQGSDSIDITVTV